MPPVVAVPLLVVLMLASLTTGKLASSLATPWGTGLTYITPTSLKVPYRAALNNGWPEPAVVESAWNIQELLRRGWTQIAVGLVKRSVSMLVIPLTMLRY